MHWIAVATIAANCVTIVASLVAVQFCLLTGFYGCLTSASLARMNHDLDAERKAIARARRQLKFAWPMWRIDPTHRDAKAKLRQYAEAYEEQLRPWAQR